MKPLSQFILCQHKGGSVNLFSDTTRGVKNNFQEKVFGV